MTKTLVLSHRINNFEALGGRAVRDGADAGSLTDPVHGLSGDGRTMTRLANNYEAFRTMVWASTLEAANVGATGRENQLYWIGLDATVGSARDGTKHQDDYHCRNFGSEEDGDSTGNLEDRGSYLRESTFPFDDDGNSIAPLLEQSGVSPCSQQNYFLCISFSRN